LTIIFQRALVTGVALSEVNDGRQDPRDEQEVMFGDGLEQSTILRTPFGASGLNPREQQSRDQERYHYDAGVRR
jgi:hypothetical protein